MNRIWSLFMTSSIFLCARYYQALTFSARVLQSGANWAFFRLESYLSLVCPCWRYIAFSMKQSQLISVGFLYNSFLAGNNWSADLCKVAVGRYPLYNSYGPSMNPWISLASWVNGQYRRFMPSNPDTRLSTFYMKKCVTHFGHGQFFMSMSTDPQSG